jgi:hypothetical protein
MGDLLGSLIWGAKSGQYCVIMGGSLQFAIRIETHVPKNKIVKSQVLKRYLTQIEMHSNSSILRKEDQILSRLHRSSLGPLLARGV